MRNKKYVGFGEWVKFRENIERDKAWLDAQRDNLMRWEEEDLLHWLRWNDRSSDDDAAYEPMSKEEMVDEIMHHVEENLETPEEMMKNGAMSIQRVLRR